MASDKLLSAFLHYSMMSLLIYIFAFANKLVEYKVTLYTLPLLPILVAIYRREYLEQWSDFLTETVIALTSLFLWPFYILPGIYYSGKKGVKESLIKEKN